MLLHSSGNQNTVTYVPAVTYLFVGLTSFVLAYFTAMDKGEESESLPKNESVTSMLPGIGTMMTDSENDQGDEKPSDEESITESEPEQSTSESDASPLPAAPLAGGKKRKTSIKKQMKKKKSKRSTKSRSA
jgi:hypothetical protein